MSHPLNHTDCVVIGAGPAGVSAAQWLESFGVAFRWVSSDGRPGGLLERVHNPISNYPGAVYASGTELAEALRSNVAQWQAARLEAGHIGSIDSRADIWQLTPGPDGAVNAPPIAAKAVILATGTRYRTLGVPGEAEGMGAYVSQSATGDGHDVDGAQVAVVGGGDAGFENALHLASHGCEVAMLLRSAQFRARPAFVERAQSHPRIDFYPFPTRVERIEPADRGCRLHLDVDSAHQTVDVACLFVRIGVEAVLPDITPSVETTEGFVVVDARQQTSHAGLFAAGDVTDCPLRSVATAVGSAGVAAQSAAQYLDYL